MYNSGNVHVVSHCDIDGHGAAAIVKQYYPQANIIITNYKKPIYINKFKPGDTIFVTDFSLPKEMFETIAKIPARIIWIDHHISAIEQLQAQGWNCEGIRRTDYSGAMLTWMYFNPDKTFDQAPDFIKLINWYDLWQHDKDPRIRPFSYGVGLWDTRPGYVSGDKFWNNIFSNANGDKMLNNIIKFGQIIQNYVEKYQDTLCKDLAYKTDLNTPAGMKKIMAMCIRPGNSSIFERMDLTGIDALFTGQYVTGTVKQYRCSVYSPDNKKEVLPIAQMYGGGGHPTAAGFTIPRYPLNLPEAKPPIPLPEAISMYNEITDLRESSPILIKYVLKGGGITAKTCSWNTTFEGRKIIAINHYYVPEIIDTLPANTECIDVDTGDVAEFYFGYVMTNCGQYRCSLHPTSTSSDIAVMHSQLTMKHPETKYEIIDNGIWWYTPTLPIEIPINKDLPQSM